MLKKRGKTAGTNVYSAESQYMLSIDSLMTRMVFSDDYGQHKGESSGGHVSVLINCTRHVTTATTGDNPEFLSHEDGIGKSKGKSSV